MSHNNTQQPSPEVAAQFAAAATSGDAFARERAHIDAQRETHAQAMQEAACFYMRHGITVGDVVAFNILGATLQNLFDGGAK